MTRRRDTALACTVACDCCGASVAMPSPLELPAEWATLTIDRMGDAGLDSTRLDLCPDDAPAVIAATLAAAAQARRRAAA